MRHLEEDDICFIKIIEANIETNKHFLPIGNGEKLEVYADKHCVDIL